MIEVFVCEELCQGPDAQRVLALLPGCGGEILAVSRPVFEKLTFGHRAEGRAGRGRNAAADARRTHRCRTIRWSPCWKASRSRATSAPSSHADGAGVSAVDRGRRRHRPLQSQRHPRQPGHDLHRSGVRSRGGRRRWPGCVGGACRSLPPGWTARWPTPRPIIAARRLWCWAARRPGFPHSGPPPT